MPRRSKYQTRQYIFECKRCGVWHPVSTLAQQQAARRRGACPACLRDRAYRRTVLARLIWLHMDALVVRGTAAPEAERAIYRVLWAKRRTQLARAQAVLELVPA